MMKYWQAHMHKYTASGTDVYIYAATSYGTKKPPQGYKKDAFCTPVGAVADCLINIVVSESFSFFSYRVFLRRSTCLFCKLFLSKHLTFIIACLCSLS